jgi:putative NIF3 family GTP cyclohydrolase 1 type 2
VSLCAAHAALDCASGFGTGWVFAELIGVAVTGTFAKLVGHDAGVWGDYV